MRPEGSYDGQPRDMLYNQESFTGQPGMGGRNTFHENPLGNEITLLAPPAADVVTNPVRLLSANLSASLGAPGQNSNWDFVLTIGISDLPTSNVALPIVAKISVGSGGVKRAFEVSLVPTTSVHILGPAVDVDVLFDRNRYGALIAPNVADQKVYGYISRGGCVSTPFRWYYLGPQVQGNLKTITGPIPPHSKSAMVFDGAGGGGIYGAGVILKFLNFPGGGAIMSYTGVQLLQILLTGGYAPIPGGATAWSIDYAFVNAEAQLCFKLEL